MNGAWNTGTRGTVVVMVLGAWVSANAGCGPDSPLAPLRCTGPWAGDECAAPDPIPAEQDALMRWFWANWDTATPAQVHEAVTNMHGLINGSSLTADISGTLDDLSPADLANVGMSDKDPSPATGLLLMSAMDCTVDHAERITTYANQPELYPGVYDSYQRTYETSLEDYLARTTDRVSWTVNSTGTLLNTAYRMHYRGGDRLVPAQEGSAAMGPILLNRSWLLEPADFDDATREIPQDYQVEVFYEHAPGKLIHLWGDWRQVRMGTLTNDDQVVLEIMLTNMQDWDQQTRTLCRENRPPPG